MERGIQYYEWNMIEKAVLEFKYVIHSLDIKSKKLDYRMIKLLSRAHHNLAVAYAKKKWYEDASNNTGLVLERRHILGLVSQLLTTSDSVPAWKKLKLLTDLTAPKFVFKTSEIPQCSSR